MELCRNSSDLIKLLKNDGWRLINISGSHHKFKHPAKVSRVIVPHPKKDLPIGTVMSIYKQAGWR
jgi:predicted RNA binding protein YcfA (HicA-like mRNA interferase family)